MVIDCDARPTSQPPSPVPTQGEHFTDMVRLTRTRLPDIEKDTHRHTCLYIPNKKLTLMKGANDYTLGSVLT